MGHGPAIHAAFTGRREGLRRLVWRAWRNGSRNGLKIRWKKFRAGSSPAARTKYLLVWLLTDEDRERITLIAHGKVSALPTNQILVDLCNALQVLCLDRTGVVRIDCENGRTLISSRALELAISGSR